ncbi:hypothetical protein CRM22_007821 [Opisthorchis felineus]|uniref:Peptidase S1 domain-containing protein n=1 Tax=Opisthorchis felineus TaxID=147828 RepID=A0A4S2LE15_OPIFE|nr:hypothetical protein CRM22_007821 [Opisthorchis felineus]
MYVSNRTSASILVATPQRKNCWRHTVTSRPMALDSFTDVQRVTRGSSPKSYGGRRKGIHTHFERNYPHQSRWFSNVSFVCRYPDSSGMDRYHCPLLLFFSNVSSPTEAYAYLSTDPARWTARVGEFDMMDEQVPHFDMHLELIFPHPEYNGTTVANDIALIKLAEQVQLGPNVNIACLPKASNGDLQGDCCIAAGWGYTQEGSTTISSVLRHVALSVFPRKHCLEAYTKLYELYGPVIPTIQETMICAGDPDGGKDTCNFDSGGPLACQVDGQWYASALTSFGWECGDPSTPGVYTDMSGYVTWIQSLIPDLATRPNGFR